MKNRKNGNLFVVFWMFLLSIGGISQTNTVPISTADTKDLIRLNLTILDKDNNMARGITKDDLIVNLDGKEQSIESIEEHKINPISILAIDNSGSMRMLLPEVTKAAKTIIAENNDTDLVALMRFVGRDKIQASEKFTNDLKYLNALLDAFYVEGGQTALIDAMYTGTGLLRAQTMTSDTMRRTLIVVSDGEDRDSQYAESQLIALLKEANVRVCFLGLMFDLGTEGGFVGKSPRQKAKEFIEKVAKETGGFAVIPKKPDQIVNAAKQISANIHSEFVVTFRPNVTSTTSRKLQIKIAKGSKMKDLQFFVTSQY